MRIDVRFRPRRLEDRAVDLPDGARIIDLMQAVGAAVDTYVAVRGGTPVAEDAPLADGDEILLLSAASGG